ncbi:MAG: hypothetical protein Q7R32_12185 [Dehalococcoidia bacterium]|nr:hypothetical protein [Dehalococcoidia bacterium]
MSPAYYAARLQQEHALPSPATMESLLAVCAARGVPVIRSPRLRHPGAYLRLPEPLIVLRPDAPAYVLAHELAHDVLAEVAPLAPGAQWVGADEPFAEAFAAALCGPRSGKPYHAPAPEEFEDDPPTSQPLAPALLRLIDLLCAEVRERTGRRTGEAP